MSAMTEYLTERGYSPAVARKAEKVLPYVETMPMPGHYRVPGSTPGRLYLATLVPSTEERDAALYRTCTCPNGRALGGRAGCYHAAAAEYLHHLVSGPWALGSDDE